MRSPHLKSARCRSAFTLIEIMLVVTIIVVLMGAAIALLRGNLEFAQDQRVEADIQAVTTQLKLYETANYAPPTTVQGLKALVERPNTEPQPRRWRQLLKEVPIDPWGNEYKYLYPGTRTPESFDLWSLGPDRVESDDDLGNW